MDGYSGVVGDQVDVSVIKAERLHSMDAFIGKGVLVGRLGAFCRDQSVLKRERH